MRRSKSKNFHKQQRISEEDEIRQLKSLAATLTLLKQIVMIVPLDQKLDMLWTFIMTRLQFKTIVFLSSYKQWHVGVGLTGDEETARNVLGRDQIVLKEGRYGERESEIECDRKLQLLSIRSPIQKFGWLLHPDTKSPPPDEPHNPRQNRA